MKTIIAMMALAFAASSSFAAPKPKAPAASKRVKSLQLDISQWDAPTPWTEAQAFWHLKNKTTAKDVKWTDHDLDLFDGKAVLTVHDAVHGLADKIDAHDASKTAYLATDVEAWGIEHPADAQEAIDVLVTMLHQLRVDFEAYKAAHP